MTNPPACRSTRHCADHGWCHRCDPDFAKVMSAVNLAIQHTDAESSHWGPLYAAVGEALRAAVSVGQPTRTETPAPVDWIDGHPQLEAIAAAVWERCRTEGTSLIVDDPRNIAVAALAALPVPSAPTTDQAGLREQVADVLAAYDGWTWAEGFDRRRSPAYQAYLTRADRVVGLLAAYDTTMRAAVQAEAFHDAADEIETQQAHIEHKERDEHGNLDHETELQGDAVRGMAKYLRTRAAGLRRLAAGAQQPAEEVDADTVANRAAQVITTMGADIRALTSERDRYRTAWRSARERAQAHMEGTLRQVANRDFWKDQCKAAEAQQQPTTETTALPDRLEAALTERYTELGNPFSEMRRREQGPDGWPASHPVGPHHVAEVLRELLNEHQPTAETHSCGNCEGIDPGSCLTNPDRPAAPPVSPAETAERLAARHHRDGWHERAQGAQDVADLLQAADREEQRP